MVRHPGQGKQREQYGILGRQDGMRAASQELRTLVQGPGISQGFHWERTREINYLALLTFPLPSLAHVPFAQLKQCPQGKVSFTGPRARWGGQNTPVGQDLGQHRDQPTTFLLHNTRSSPLLSSQRSTCWEKLARITEKRVQASSTRKLARWPPPPVLPPPQPQRPDSNQPENRDER